MVPGPEGTVPGAPPRSGPEAMRWRAWFWAKFSMSGRGVNTPPDHTPPALVRFIEEYTSTFG